MGSDHGGMHAFSVSGWTHSHHLLELPPEVVAVIESDMQRDVRNGSHGDIVRNLRGFLGYRAGIVRRVLLDSKSDT